MNLKKLSIENYHYLIKKFGLEKVWNKMCFLLKNCTPETFSGEYYDYDKLGWLYENGLAYTNKISKKELGKYYTPKDVADIMSEFLFENDNKEILADTGCGTGNLVLSALEQTNKIKTIYLYDLDKMAMNICEAKIISKYKNKYTIIKQCGDFLEESVSLPKKCKVIANPSYSRCDVDDKYANCLPAFKQSNAQTTP